MDGADVQEPLVDESRTAGEGPIDSGASTPAGEPAAQGAPAAISEATENSNSETEVTSAANRESAAATAGEASATGLAKLSDERKSAWSAAMQMWRNYLAKADFAAAQARQAEIREMVETLLQQQQFDRLRTVAELAEQFESSLREAVLGLAAGESFTVAGPAQIGFVEGDSQRVVLRISGRNKTFSLHELPSGIAYGLADLRLDQVHPKSKAVKAAYGLLHAARSNQAAWAEARQWMASAEAEGAVPAGTSQVFDDDYRL
jgi:hypothetical protein